MKIFIPGKSTITIYPASGKSISIPGEEPVSIVISEDGGSALPETIWVSSPGGDYWVSSAGGNYWVSTV